MQDFWGGGREDMEVAVEVTPSPLSFLGEENYARFPAVFLTPPRS